MTNDKTYNGWTNYETWNCNLHFDDCFTEQAQEIYDEAEEGDILTRDEQATADLADYIEEYVQESTPTMSEGGFFEDVMKAAVQQVNWYEIAKHYILDVEKGE